MTGPDLTLELAAAALVDAFRGLGWRLTVRDDPRRPGSLELLAENPDAKPGEYREARAVLNRGEDQEFPYRVDTAAKDLRAYVEAILGRPNAVRLGQIPNGRIPAFDEARDRGIIDAGGARPVRSPFRR